LIPIIATATLLSVVGLAAIGALVVQNQVEKTSDRFWRLASFQGASGPRFDTLADLVVASDVVVLGRIASVERGRVFGTPHADNPNPASEQIHYAAVAVNVERVLDGALVDGAASELTLELPVSSPDAIPQLAKSVPSEQSVLFLFNAGLSAAAQGLPDDVQARESKYYALLAFGAVMRDIGGAPRVADPTDLGFLTAFESSNFDAFLRKVEAVR
jgi:hypothetical protein